MAAARPGGAGGDLSLASTALPGTLLGPGAVAPPLWAEECLGTGAGAAGFALARGRGETRRGEGFSLTSVHLSGIEGMDVQAFQHAVAEAYRAVLDRIQDEHALRFWAFVPRIHADYGGGLDRYMAFNAGRFAAFSSWLRDRDAESRRLPTGSAVGSGSADFALFCLASRWPGSPVENPRQLPAYRYSRRFGPLPPCFARATLLKREPEAPNLLLVGGTASITGEDSQHLGDLGQQTRETLLNLASVVRSACREPGAPSHAREDHGSEPLRLFRDLRAYFRDPGDRQPILELVTASFPGVERIEMLAAELCRPELLVEIEGVARLP